MSLLGEKGENIREGSYMFCVYEELLFRLTRSRDAGQTLALGYLCEVSQDDHA